MPTTKKQGNTNTAQGEIAPAKGKLGIMIPGMGAVATTFVAGVEAVRKGISSPIGSLTQMGTIRLGKRTEGRFPKINEFVPLAGLNDLVFTGWDIFEDNMYSAARNAGGGVHVVFEDVPTGEDEIVQPGEWYEFVDLGKAAFGAFAQPDGAH